jgi:predicted HicB family RNase H-like nuclease
VHPLPDRSRHVAAKQAGTSLNVWISQKLAHETQHLD